MNFVFTQEQFQQVIATIKESVGKEGRALVLPPENIQLDCIECRWYDDGVCKHEQDGNLAVTPDHYCKLAEPKASGDVQQVPSQKPKGRVVRRVR